MIADILRNSERMELECNALKSIFHEEHTSIIEVITLSLTYMPLDTCVFLYNGLFQWQYWKIPFSDYFGTHIVPDRHAFRILVHQPVCDVPVVVVDRLVEKTSPILILLIFSPQHHHGLVAFFIKTLSHYRNKLELTRPGQANHEFKSESILNISCTSASEQGEFRCQFQSKQIDSWSAKRIDSLSNLSLSSHYYKCIWMDFPIFTFERASLALPSMAWTSRRLPWATAAWSASIFCIYLSSKLDIRLSMWYRWSNVFSTSHTWKSYEKISCIPWDCLQELSDFCVGCILRQQLVTL